LSRWITKTLTLDKEWEVRFRLAFLAGEEQLLVTPAAVEVQQNFAEKDKAYTAPKTKRKWESVEVLAAIGISPYKRHRLSEKKISKKRGPRRNHPTLDWHDTWFGWWTQWKLIGIGQDPLQLRFMRVSKSRSWLLKCLSTSLRPQSVEPTGLACDIDATTMWSTISAIE
jgi:hypothetical protein